MTHYENIQCCIKSLCSISSTETHKNSLANNKNTQVKIKMFVVIASATLHITVSLSFMWFIKKKNIFLQCTPLLCPTNLNYKENLEKATSAQNLQTTFFTFNCYINSS